MKPRPDLIVPIRDRRRRRRIITLKNLGRFAIAVAILFLALTFQGEFHRSNADGYGRLFNRQVPVRTALPAPRPAVIVEQPVRDETAADPLLIEPAAREQYLGSPELEPQPRAAEGAAVDGPNGITIVRNPQRSRPLLSGGIFRR
ncbi:MAG TPA: hypothetical protein VKH35_08385 [Thermoanaerobaculia bacterium]|jgi:hypothetical protein|nr:hypothetical protein [Thermoanaerobaculia bacterium]